MVPAEQEQWDPDVGSERTFPAQIVLWWTDLVPNHLHRGWTLCELDWSLKVLVVVWLHFAKGFLVSHHAERFEGGEGEERRKLKGAVGTDELVRCSNLIHLLLLHIGQNSMLNSSRGKAMC